MIGKIQKLAIALLVAQAEAQFEKPLV